MGMVVVMVFMAVSDFLLDFEHLLEGIGFLSNHVLAFFAFAQVSAVHSLLIALTVFLLAVTLPAIAAFEMSLFLFRNC